MMSPKFDASSNILWLTICMFRKGNPMHFNTCPLAAAACGDVRGIQAFRRCQLAAAGHFDRPGGFVEICIPQVTDG